MGHLCKTLFINEVFDTGVKLILSDFDGMSYSKLLKISLLKKNKVKIPPTVLQKFKGFHVLSMLCKTSHEKNTYL